jgi:predicted ester cyclase
MSEENVALQRRFVEAYQTGRDEAVADEILAAGFVNHAAMPGLPNDREGVKMLFRAFWSAFPDFRMEIHDMFGAGDRVATRKTIHGTHEGEFMGFLRPAARSPSTSSTSCATRMESWPSTGMSSIS